MPSAVSRVPLLSLAPEIITEIWVNLTRQSKSRVLAVSRAWQAQARAIPYMWTEFEFGPGSIPNDLLIANRWLGDSGALTIAVTIRRPPSGNVTGGLSVASILEEFVQPISYRLKHLHISACELNVDIIQTFIASVGFSTSLKSLVVILEGHWLRTVRNLPTPSAILTNHPSPFYHLNLPSLVSLHMSNIPPFWPTAPATGISLTEVVLGLQIDRLVPSLRELKDALESAPVLVRLGFFQELPYQPASAENLSISLPTVTSLAFHRLTHDSLRRLLSILVVQRFSDLTISLHPDETSGTHENALQIVEQLHIPEFATALRTLNIQNFAPHCDPAFFKPFQNLQTLRLDFTPGSLSTAFWAALVDPTTDGPKSLPALRSLTLVGLNVIHVQEIVHLRNLAAHPRLELLELILEQKDAVVARSFRWSAWLEKNHVPIPFFEFYGPGDPPADAEEDWCMWPGPASADTLEHPHLVESNRACFLWCHPRDGVEWVSSVTVRQRREPEEPGLARATQIIRAYLTGGPTKPP
ncbi:hypothetical protein B0H17DRAFT_1203062 [Mycena rosella]|uniref:F-box domain-containing protein n=1 Tax=Mycena rosella TaxID=1033263 RepID=A0AAD7DCG8_MYCRO|nr:hypothetical protein B0H17DRAFT_1203062 [Mycena rosella]